MAWQTTDPHMLAPYLGIFGLAGMLALLIAVGKILWQYRRSPAQSFRWHIRNWHLKRIAAVACLFFLAMAASCAVLSDPWGWGYFVIAARIGVWWARRAISQRI